MNKVSFFILSLLSLVTNVAAFKGCESDQMNELCQTNPVDHCYTCLKVNEEQYPHPPVCVPVFHNNLGVLENYPRDQWNCTIYRPLPVKTTDSEIITNELENITKDICKIDDFIVDMCQEEDKNGFCMIANYIHDMCDSNVETNKNDEESSVKLENIKYESPWGPLSECNQYFYKEICTNKVAKLCFDCRKYLGKELFTQKPRYHYYCSPFYKDMNEKETVDWFTKEKYECKRWYNPNYNPSSFSTSNYETKGKLYSACSGPICSKEGWFYRGDHFGKEWCGMGTCKEYFGNSVLCDFPTNCGKKNNLSVNEHNFQTLGCGYEKFKCMIKKNCRNLIKELENCKSDQACILSILIQNDDETFMKLTKCMFS
jgi:hypothetical protein